MYNFLLTMKPPRGIKHIHILEIIKQKQQLIVQASFLLASYFLMLFIQAYCSQTSIMWQLLWFPAVLGNIILYLVGKLISAC